MARMIAEVYDALRSAGADDAKARAAAIALADSDRRFEDVGTEIRGSEHRLDHRITEVEQSLGQRITEVEQSLGQRITDVEHRLDRRITEVEQSLGQRITEVEQGLGKRIEQVQQDLRQQINRLERRLTVTEWNVRLNTVILIGLLLKLVVFN